MMRLVYWLWLLPLKMFFWFFRKAFGPTVSDQTKAWIAGGYLAFSVAFVLLAAILVFNLFAWSMEAQAFNRLTDKHATIWDAVWLDLRVCD